jgi:hypothetical protein
MFTENAKQNSSAMPTKPAQLSIEEIKAAKKKLKDLLAEEYEGEIEVFNLLEYIGNINQKNVPQCYLDILYEVPKNTPIVLKKRIC